MWLSDVHGVKGFAGLERATSILCLHQFVDVHGDHLTI